MAIGHQLSWCLSNSRPARERAGSGGEDELDEITDSAEESEENELAQTPVAATVTPQVTTPTSSVRHTGRSGIPWGFSQLVVFHSPG